MVDAAGTPLAIEHTAANVHDSRMAIALVDAIPRIKQPDGTRRRRPVTVFADRAYDAEEAIRKALRRRGIIPFFPNATRNMEADWARSATSSRRRSIGCSTTDGFACATKNETTFTKRSSSSLACSSAGDESRSFVRVP